MTDEEINRKFDVVANHLASLAVGLQDLREQVADLAELQQRAEKRWSQTEASIRSLLAITEIQSQEIKILAQEIKELSESVKAVDSRQRETDERLNALINTVERYISERRNGRE